MVQEFYSYFPIWNRAVIMTKGQYAKPFNQGKSSRDLRVHIPKIRELVECPANHKTFDRFATIELLEEEMQGEVDYYCPHCDALIPREFRSTDRQCIEVVDTDHRIEAK
jgi:hypothetical protein